MNAVSDATFTMLPPRSPIEAAAARAHRNVPRTLTANMRSHSSSGISSYGRRLTRSAALFTSPSTAPMRREQRVDLVGIAHIALLVRTRRDVDGHDLRSPGTQLGGELGADAPPGAGDDDVLAADRHAELLRLLDELGQRVVDVAVRCEHVRQARSEVERPAVEILDAPTCLADHQRARAHVPRVGGIAFEERIDAARGDEGEAERGGAQPPHTAAVEVQLDDAAAVGLDRLSVVGLDAGAHEGAVERRRVEETVRSSLPRYAPPPRTAVNSSRRNGSKIAPAARPSASRTATEVQAKGMPCA